MVSWFSPIIVALEYTDHRGLGPYGGKGVYEAITDFQDQIELLSECGCGVPVCPF